ncbi:MAG: hydrogenase maturation nickel metallochaperone HypA [Pseudomonadota bacterium]
MHELSLCEGVLQLIEANAARSGFTRVRGVQLEIGELAGVDTEALRFSFDVVTRGTMADAASLAISPVPGQAWCMACSNTVHVSRRVDPCPDCGSHQLQVNGGDDMVLKSLEVE